MSSLRAPRWLPALAVAASVLGAPRGALPDAAADASPEPSAAPEPSAPTAPSAPSAQPTVPEVEGVARSVASEHALEGASVGIAVVDVDSGRVLAAVNEHLALNPASNAKLYTAAAALAILRGDHRYETTLSGKLEGDAVSGPLVLRGYGDPSLSTADLSAMVDELRSYGVRRVDGGIAVDQRFYDELTTPPAFDQQPNEWAGFRAPVSAVAVDENCVALTVRPGAVGSTARLDFEPPGFVDVDGSVRTVEAGAADNVELALAGSGSRMTARVSGTIGADSRLVRYTRRTEDPRLLAGYVLKALLEKAEIHVAGEIHLARDREVEAARRVLARHASEPLSALLYGLGKQSDNFYAEMIFKSLAAETRTRPGHAADAADIVTGWLDKIGARDPGVVIKNGSGLFDANRVTAWSTVTLLRGMWRDPVVQPEYVAQLSIAGVDGTLHKRLRGEATRRHVRAKTGTLDDAIALSGYVLREGGRGPVAFSVMFNRVAGKQDTARKAADRFVEALARWARGP